MNRYGAPSAALLALLAGACTVGPRYRPPPALASGAAAPAFLSAQTPAFSAAPPPPGWWRLYNDAQLDALVSKALRRNTDLRVALATLEQAQAELDAARAERTPSTPLSGGLSYGQASADEEGLVSVPPPGPFYTLSAGVSYDLDLFGRLRRGVEEARANVGATEAALDLARVNVAGEVAGAYVGVCSAGLRSRVAERSLDVARQALFVVERRYQAGIDSSTEVVRARTLVRQVEAELPAFAADRRRNLYLLTTLTGDAPERLPPGVEGCESPPRLRAPLPVGDGTALLRRRPDIREAELTLHARVAAVGVATAALYPSVTLGGSIGTEAASVHDIVSARGFTWNLGPMVSWNFPNQLATRAQIRGADASAREALARFDGVVLSGLRETETAMDALARELDAETALRQAADDAERASIDTRRLYTGGVGEFIDTLDAERTAITADDALAQASAAVSQDQVSLFMALGGGWENAPTIIDIAYPQASPRPSRPFGRHVTGDVRRSH